MIEQHPQKYRRRLRMIQLKIRRTMCLLQPLKLNSRGDRPRGSLRGQTQREAYRQRRKRRPPLQHHRHCTWILQRSISPRGVQQLFQPLSSLGTWPSLPKHSVRGKSEVQPTEVKGHSINVHRQSRNKTCTTKRRRKAKDLTNPLICTTCMCIFTSSSPRPRNDLT